MNLPDDLMRAVKLRALEENRSLQDTIADLLRRGLAWQQERPTPAKRRVSLPLVKCAHPAQYGQELTPERVARILIDEEAGATGGSL